MPEKSQTYVKNNAESVARFLFPLEAKKHKRKFGKRIKDCAALMADLRAAFPPTRNGFLTKHVKEFFKFRVQSSEFRVPNAQPNLPPQPDGGKQGELLEREPNFEASLDIWEDKLKNPLKWLESPIQKFQITFLEQYRPHLFPKSEPTPSPNSVEQAAFNSLDECNSYAELAERLSLHYRHPDGSSKLKWEIDRQTVSDWKQGRRLDGAPPPPGMLPQRAKRTWSLRQWIGWFDQHLWDKWRLDNVAELRGTTVGGSLREQREQDEREQIEFNRWERQKELGKYIEVTEAARLAAGMMRQLAADWKDRNETQSINALENKLKELGVDAGIISVTREYMALQHRQFTNEIESRWQQRSQKYEAEAKQLAEQLVNKN